MAYHGEVIDTYRIYNSGGPDLILTRQQAIDLLHSLAEALHVGLSSASRYVPPKTQRK